jgi:alpha-tubulin suppressor-like RCC1 family protein
MHDATHMLLLVQELGKQKQELGKQKQEHQQALEKQKQEHQQEMVGMRRFVGQTFKRCAQGTVHAVGNNELGCLGDGTQIDRSSPVSVVGLGQRVAAVAAGSEHSLFLLEDGSVNAVGDNNLGQLGDGTQTCRITPVSVVGLRQRVTAVAAGDQHSLFLLEDGSVKAVGCNRHCQLGDCTTANRSRPVPVVGLGQRVTAVGAGGDYTVFLLEDGSVKAVGKNYNGQLGDGTTHTDGLLRLVVDLGQRVTAVAAGTCHTVFLLEDGSVKAVGYNGHCQLGDDTQIDRSRPVPVVGLGQRATAVGAGGWYSVFLLEDGSVKAVGCNDQGQLGDGTAANRSRPVLVVDLGQRVTAVGAGGEHTVFLLEDGSVKAVGANGYGQLSDGTQIDRSRPVELGLPHTRPAVGIYSGYLSVPVSIYAGSCHSMVLR